VSHAKDSPLDTPEGFNLGERLVAAVAVLLITRVLLDLLDTLTEGCKGRISVVVDVEHGFLGEQGVDKAVDDRRVLHHATC
jgi:hypothetical protein